MSATDTRPNEDLRKRIQEREEELKALLRKIVEEPIDRPESQFGGLEMLADLTWGLKDTEFDREMWIRVALRFKELPFDVLPFNFDDLLKRFPDDAPAVFEEIAKSGNDIIKPYAREYLEKSRKLSAARETGATNPLNPKADDHPVATDIDSGKSLNIWYLVYLAGAVVICVAAVSLRLRRK